MKNKISYLIATAAIAGLAQVASASPISIEISTDGVNWTSEGSGTSGATLGTWTISSLGGVLTGTAASPDLDLDSLNVSGGIGSLYIAISATGFGPTSDGVSAFLGGHAGGIDSVNWYGFAGASNSLFDMSSGSQIFGVLGLTGNIGATASGSINLTSYSLTEEYVITGGSSVSLNSSSDSLDGDIQVVPDGGTTVLLLGAGLSGLAFLKRKLVA